MLRSDQERDRERDRGGEAPMEIDSPPPLWLKSPTSPASFHGPITQAPSVTNTPTAVAPSSNLSGPSVTCDSSPMEPISSPLAATTLETPNSTPLSRTPFLRSHTSPVTVMTGSTGKSPLRSCHTNSDAVTNLRRLATATFNSSPPNRSPTVLMMLNRRGHTPQSQKKRRNGGTDPTKVAAAAALVTSSSTAWHLHLPIILMNYFQLIFNTFIGVGILYLAFSATRTILHDAQLKVDERLQVMISEISLCSRQYQENRCNPDQRVPAMEKVCMEWETCMSRDPSTTSRARLHAETIAEILNGFFGAISTKTYIFMIGGTVLVLVLFNAAFYFGRNSQQGSLTGASNHRNPLEYSQSLTGSHHHLSYSAPSSPLMIK